MTVVAMCESVYFLLSESCCNTFSLHFDFIYLFIYFNGLTGVWMFNQFSKLRANLPNVFLGHLSKMSYPVSKT